MVFGGFFEVLLFDSERVVDVARGSPEGVGFEDSIGAGGSETKSNGSQKDKRQPVDKTGQRRVNQRFHMHCNNLNYQNQENNTPMYIHPHIIFSQFKQRKHRNINSYQHFHPKHHINPFIKFRQKNRFNCHL